MDGRQLSVGLAMLWVVLAVGFVIVENLLLAGVAVLALLGSLLQVWWYTTRNARAGS